MVIPVTLGRPRSIAAAQDAVRAERQIGVLTQRDASVDEPGEIDLYRIGTVANVVRYLTGKDGSHHVVSQGEQRFRVVEFLHGWPFLVARIERIAPQEADSPQIQARFLNLKRQALEALELLPQVPQELVQQINAISDAGALADIVAAYLDLTIEQKQEVLETIDLTARIDRVSRFLAERIEVLRLSQEIGQQTRASLDKRQREVLLREQMAAIQKELGESDGKADRGRRARRGDHQGRDAEGGRGAGAARAAAPRAHARGRGRIRHDPHLSRLADRAAVEAARPRSRSTSRRRAASSTRTTTASTRSSAASSSISPCASSRPKGKAPILCFVGPPGVGKTSLGQSIARAMGRKFVRVSLGGVHDEAEIRGHRRTYVGALPGNIIQGIRRAGARNAVMMLDEIDKLGARHPGRSVGGAARGARPGAEQHLPRQLPRGAVRSLPRRLHHHGERARHDPRAASRPHGDHLARRLHRRREARDRQALPGQAPARGERPQAGAGRDQRRGAPRDHRPLHARGRRAQPRTRDRPRAPQRRGRDRRGQGASRSKIDDEGPRRRARPAALRERGGDADERARRRHRPRLDPGRRRHPVRRGDAHPGLGPADPHRPARRRDEGERAGRARAWSRAGSTRSASTRRFSRRATSTSTSRPARSPRTGRAPASRCRWRWSRSSPTGRSGATPR